MTSQYRYLDAGETIEPGDEIFSFILNKWSSAEIGIGFKVKSNIYRRPIKNDDWKGINPVEGWRPLYADENILKDDKWINLKNGTRGLYEITKLNQTPNHYEKIFPGEYIFIRRARMIEENKILNAREYAERHNLEFEELKVSPRTEKDLSGIPILIVASDGETQNKNISNIWNFAEDNCINQNLKNVVEDLKEIENNFDIPECVFNALPAYPEPTKKDIEKWKRSKNDKPLFIDELNSPTENQKSQEIPEHIFGNKFLNLTMEQQILILKHELLHLEMTKKQKSKKELPYSTLNLSFKDHARLEMADHLLKNQKREVEVPIDEQWGEEFEG